MPKPTILIDKREQKPYLFTGYDCDILRRSTPTGDYTVLGLEDRVTIERKELSDCVSTVTRDRERFRRELERMRSYEFAAIVIEASAAKLAHGPYPHSRANPSSVFGSLISFALRYGVHVVFAGDAKMGEEYTFRLLEMFWRYANLEKVMGPDTSPGLA